MAKQVILVGPLKSHVTSTRKFKLGENSASQIVSDKEAEYYGKLPFFKIIDLEKPVVEPPVDEDELDEDDETNEDDDQDNTSEEENDDQSENEGNSEGNSGEQSEEKSVAVKKSKKTKKSRK